MNIKYQVVHHLKVTFPNVIGSLPCICCDRDLCSNLGIWKVRGIFDKNTTNCLIRVPHESSIQLRDLCLNRHRLVATLAICIEIQYFYLNFCVVLAFILNQRLNAPIYWGIVSTDRNCLQFHLRLGCSMICSYSVHLKKKRSES